MVTKIAKAAAEVMAENPDPLGIVNDAKQAAHLAVRYMQQQGLVEGRAHTELKPELVKIITEYCYGNI